MEHCTSAHAQQKLGTSPALNVSNTSKYQAPKNKAGVIFKQSINKIQSNPKSLFVIDGLGALLSSFLLGIVLVKLEPIVGIPRPTLYLLALLPCLFAVYDFCCYHWLSDNLGVFLKGIAFLNIGYCGLSIGLAIYHHQPITYFGWAYLLIEVVVVMLLSMLEMSTAAKWKDGR